MEATLENLARWIDELAAEIEILKRKKGGGDDVTITPTLESGAKIADYTIGENEGALYAPTPDAPPVVVYPFIGERIAAQSGAIGNAQLDFTATEDCWVYVDGQFGSGNNYLAIDAHNIFKHYGAGFGGTSVFMKAGQKLTSTGFDTSFQYWMKDVYKLQKSTDTINNAKKVRAKK